MLRRLILIASFLFPLMPVGAILFPDHAACAQEHKPQAQSKQAQTPPMIPSADGKPKKEQSDQLTAQSSSQDDAWTRWGVIINAVLVAVTGIIAITGYVQARAAKLAAEAVMRSERAYLLPHGEKLGPPYLMAIEEQRTPEKHPAYCDIALKNYGNTPASAVHWDFELQVGNSTESPPSSEIYTRPASEDQRAPFPIGQGSFQFSKAILTPEKYLQASEKAEIVAGRKTIWLCGISIYTDVFERRRLFRRSPIEHRTLVCLRYIYSRQEWVLGGPSGYNKAD